MDPKNGIFEKNLESELNKLSKVHFKMNLNLNRNEINCFRAKMDPDQAWTHGTMWPLSLKLKDKLDKSNLREDPVVLTERERERKGRGGEFSKLISSIYGVPSIGIYRTKNESSSTRRGLHVGTENTGFR